MRVFFNGETRELEAGATVAVLLAELALDPRQVAVLVNEEFVPTERRSATPLQADDRVEVLTFVGGG